MHLRAWLRLKLFRFPLWAWLARQCEQRVPQSAGFGPFRGPDENIVSLFGDANADGAEFEPPTAVITAKREDL